MIYSDEIQELLDESIDGDVQWPLLLLEETSLYTTHLVSKSAGQLLANTIFELAACVELMDESPEVAKEGLIALENELRAGLDEVHDLVFELNPPFLHKVGLVSALKRYITRWSEQTDVAVTIDLDPEIRRLPKAIEITTFRIIQEALRSIRYRADTTAVRIRLVQFDSHLDVRVEDDGVPLIGNRRSEDAGIPPWDNSRRSTPPSAQTSSRLMLSRAGMEKRAHIIGADLTITSDPDDGTRLHLRIPQREEQAP